MIRILGSYQRAAKRARSPRKAVRLEEAERIVAPILADVRDARRRGAARIRAQVRRLRRRLASASPVRGSLDAGVRARRRHRRGEHSRICATPASAGTLRRLSGRPQAGPDRASAGFDGRLYSRRPLSAAVHAPDDRDSRAGGRCRRPSASRARSPAPEILGIARWLGVTHLFQHGRRAGHRGARLRNRNGADGRPHRRARATSMSPPRRS